MGCATLLNLNQHTIFALAAYFPFIFASHSFFFLPSFPWLTATVTQLGTSVLLPTWAYKHTTTQTHFVDYIFFLFFGTPKSRTQKASTKTVLCVPYHCSLFADDYELFLQPLPPPLSLLFLQPLHRLHPIKISKWKWGWANGKKQKERKKIEVGVGGFSCGIGNSGSGGNE